MVASSNSGPCFRSSIMVRTEPLITPHEKIAVVAVVETMVQLVVKRPKQKNGFAAEADRFKAGMAGRCTDRIPLCVKEDEYRV